MLAECHNCPFAPFGHPGRTDLGQQVEPAYQHDDERLHDQSNESVLWRSRGRSDGSGGMDNRSMSTTRLTSALVCRSILSYHLLTSAVSMCGHPDARESTGVWPSLARLFLF